MCISVLKLGTGSETAKMERILPMGKGTVCYIGTSDLRCNIVSSNDVSPNNRLPNVPVRLM